MKVAGYDHCLTPTTLNYVPPYVSRFHEILVLFYLRVLTYPCTGIRHQPNPVFRWSPIFPPYIRHGGRHLVSRKPLNASPLTPLNLTSQAMAAVAAPAPQDFGNHDSPLPPPQRFH